MQTILDILDVAQGDISVLADCHQAGDFAEDNTRNIRLKWPTEKQRIPVVSSSFFQGLLSNLNVISRRVCPSRCVGTTNSLEPGFPVDREKTPK